MIVQYVVGYDRDIRYCIDVFESEKASLSAQAFGRVWRC